MAKELTVSQVAQSLRQGDEVEFFPGRGVFDAHPGMLWNALADALERRVEGTSVVHCGYRTSSFDADGSGALVWWLVLDTEVLEVTLSLRLGADQPRHRAVTQVETAIHPGDRLEPRVLRLDYPPFSSSDEGLLAVTGNVRIGNRDLNLQADGSKDATPIIAFFAALEACRRRALRG